MPENSEIRKNQKPAHYCWDRADANEGLFHAPTRLPQTHETMVERSLFRAWLLSVYNDLERTDDTVSR